MHAIKTINANVLTTPIVPTWVLNNEFGLIFADCPYPSLKKGLSFDEVVTMFNVAWENISKDGVLVLFGNPLDVFTYHEAQIKSEFSFPLINHLTWNKAQSTKPQTEKWKMYTEHILIYSDCPKFKNPAPHWEANISPLPHRRDTTKHAHAKPGALIKLFIEIYTRKDTKILDMFAGSGTVATQSKSLNRSCLAFEIDKNARCFYEKESTQ